LARISHAFVQWKVFVFVEGTLILPTLEGFTVIKVHARDAVLEFESFMIP